MNFTGLLVGLSTFLIIGFFHPLVIKSEYYLGVKSWWLFLFAGIISRIPSTVSTLYSNLITGTMKWWMVLLVVVGIGSAGGYLTYRYNGTSRSADYTDKQRAP